MRRLEISNYFEVVSCPHPRPSPLLINYSNWPFSAGRGEFIKEFEKLRFSNSLIFLPLPAI